MQQGQLSILGDVDAASAALEDNFRNKVTYFPRQHSGMHVRQMGDVVCVDSSTACDSFNCVVGGSFTRADSLAIAQTVHDYYAQRHLPVAWWVGPSSNVAARRDILTQVGFAKTEAETGMVAAVADLQDVAVPSELRVVRVQTEAQVTDFARVLASLFPQDAGEMEHYYAALARTLLPNEKVVRYFVGYVGDAAVTTASLFCDDNVAALYDLATRTAFRRRGFGTVMTSIAFQEARTAGHQVAGLLASHDGQGLYARLGFRSVCNFDVYG